MSDQDKTKEAAAVEAKIIDAFTRKPFVAPQPTKRGANKPKVDQYSLGILETALEHVRSGALSHVSLTGIAHQSPVVLRVYRDATMAELALEGLGADMLKEFVFAQVEDRINPTVETTHDEDPEAS